MRETERRIKEYQERLPHMKEKLAAVALMLVISVAMMTSATFAWVVLSKSPEVKGMTTTVAANGNLEIALVNGDGTKEPAASQVGDSGKDIISKNITWGNLVNLSDPSYGLENITLRPATLNLSKLLDSPLRGAEYGDDGRVTKLSSDFAYTNYDSENETFVVPTTEEYGVRAISTIRYGSLTGDATYIECLDLIETTIGMAEGQYEALVGTSDGENPYITVISGLIGDYLTMKFGGDDDMDCTKYVVDINNMMQDFKKCMDTTGLALTYIANTQVLINTGEVGTYTLDSLLATSSSELSNAGINLTTLSQYKTNLTKLDGYLVKMEDYVQQTTVMWSDISEIINFMVDINSCIVKGKTTQYAVGSIGKSAAMELLNDKPYNGYITKGALKDMEQWIGNKLYAEDVTIKATYIVSIKLPADSITTTAEAPFTLHQDFEYMQSTYNGEIVGTDAMAEDIYAMALDFWVRTNTQNSFLTLEGSSETSTVQDTDKDGNPYYVDEDGVQYVKKTENGEDVYYYKDTDQVADVTGLTLSAVNKTVITGYNGVNRVWEEGALGGDSSSTQGAGSCYVFYSDNPQDVQQALELLGSMKVAFIDDKGNLLAYADMNVDEAYEEPGHVTVPLKLRSNSIIAGTNEMQENIYAITQLESGVATRITALVYLDGSSLTNDEVLAAADIQGQLNIQFGSTSELENAEDTELYDEMISITATADQTSFDFEEDVDQYGKITTGLTVTVGGKDAGSVGVNFARAINSSQGKRLSRVNLTKHDDGTWKTDVSFSAPGVYTLRTVWIDGIEYRLNEPVTITITGFAIDSVSWTMTDSGGYAYVMTSDNWVETKVTVGFGSDSIVPGKVQGIFESDDNQSVTVNFSLISSNWTGTARFTTSGVYRLKYIIADGEYYEVPSDKQKILTAYLGVKSRVWIDESDFVYEGPKSLNVSATISDDKGNAIKGLSDVILEYRFGTSANAVLLDSDMTWNAATERYEGIFQVSQAGTYTYRMITVGDNSQITSATVAPTIRAIPPEPPAYQANKTDEYQFAPDKNASFSVSISNSETATVKAVLMRTGAVDSVEVDGIAGTTITSNGSAVTTWKFAIPETNQEGTWTLQELCVQDVYYNDQYISGDNWLSWDMTDENIVTRVVNNVHVKVEGQDTVFTGYFMDEHKVEGLTLTIADYSGEALPDVSDVKMTYYFIDGTNTNYTSSHLDENPTDAHPTTTFTLVPGSTTKYVADSVLNFIYAGQYAGELQFTLNGKTYTYAHSTIDSDDVSSPTYTAFTDGQAPTYEVQWTTPVVKFTGVNPSGSVNVCTSASGGYTENGGTNSYSDYVLTAYMRATSSTTCGLTRYNYTVSTGTAQLSEGGNNFKEASCVVYRQITSDGNTDNLIFTFTSNTTNTQNIGAVKTNTAATDTKYPLGNNCKATTVELTDASNNTYSFTLDNSLTVNNPY